MVRFVLEQDKFEQFKSIFKLIGGLVNEVQINITQEALIIRATDVANVCMALLDLEKSFFKEFDVEKPIKFGADIGELNRVLGRFDMGIECDVTELLTIKGETSTKEVKTFSLSTIDITEKQQKRPELEYSGEIIMKSEYFSNTVEDVAVVTNDVVSFLVENKKFSIKAGGKKSDANIDFGNNVRVELPSEDIEARYSIEYLSKISAKITEDIHIKIKKDVPLSVDYKGTDFILTFILAPRVENE